MIRYVKENAFEHIGDHDVMLVGTNLYASMANGFQLDVSLNYPYVFNTNVKSKYGDRNKLGTILECKEEGKPTFVLCFITIGYNFRPDLEKDYLQYEALKKCLELVNIAYKGLNVGTTLLGASRFDGFGDRDRIMAILNETLTDVECTVYDYPQLSRKEKVKATYDLEKKIKAVDREAYYKLVKERKKKAEERFAANGRRRY